MEKVIRIETISEYNSALGFETKHPLVSVINFYKSKPMENIIRNLGFYAIYLKDFSIGEMRYGRKHYDYQEGTLVFLAPGQISSVQTTEAWFQPKGYGLLFHPDLIRGTSLGRKIQDYTFFSYDVNEGLHLSDQERVTIQDCLSKIDYEISENIDQHSKTLIVSTIELFLNYCLRFYDRQYETRETTHKGVLEKFEHLLNTYFQSAEPQQSGLPSVAYFSEKMNLSANYFGDLVKKTTGIAAQEYIQSKLINISKDRIFDGGKSISEIAYELGFKYPQHFTRLFKQKTGMSPHEYREMN